MGTASEGDGSFEQKQGDASHALSVPRFVGTHADIRSLLDYTWHSMYAPERVEVQDQIIEQFCGRPHNHRRELLPRVIFTWGAMGAGKGYVTSWMDKEGYLPLDRCVMVDPDRIRQTLPEWQDLVKEDAENAGRRTQKEAGCIAEILGYKALRNRFDVIFDGSLRDAGWYINFFKQLRDQFPGIRIIILHITADRQEVLERAANRAQMTGRVVPTNVLLESMEAVPRSVSALAPYADFVCRIHNSGNEEPHLEREPAAPYPPPSVAMQWELLRQLWTDIDTNGDGELSVDEVNYAVEHGLLTSRVLETIDVNHDGAISSQEIEIARWKARLSTMH